MKKAKISLIDPARDLVDVWRLFRSSIENEKWDYPFLGETHESEVQAYLNRYMLQNQHFFGLIMRLGKRPIAQVFGSINSHPMGLPRHYYFIHNFWVEPDFRGAEGYGQELFAAILEEMKRRGVYHWEAIGFDKFTRRLLKSKAFGVRKLYTRIGGKA